jgi:hypothetical protein
MAEQPASVTPISVDARCLVTTRKASVALANMPIQPSPLSDDFSHLESEIGTGARKKSSSSV